MCVYIYIKLFHKCPLKQGQSVTTANLLYFKIWLDIDIRKERKKKTSINTKSCFFRNSIFVSLLKTEGNKY